MIPLCQPSWPPEIVNCIGPNWKSFHTICNVIPCKAFLPSAPRTMIQVSVPEPPLIALLFNIIWEFPLFSHIFPIHPIHIYFKKTNQTYLSYFNCTCNSKLTLFGHSNFVCILSYFFSAIFQSFPMFHIFISTY